MLASSHLVFSDLPTLNTSLLKYCVFHYDCGPLLLVSLAGLGATPDINGQSASARPQLTVLIGFYWICNCRLFFCFHAGNRGKIYGLTKIKLILIYSNIVFYIFSSVIQSIYWYEINNSSHGLVLLSYPSAPGQYLSQPSGAAAAPTWSSSQNILGLVSAQNNVLVKSFPSVWPASQFDPCLVK